MISDAGLEVGETGVVSAPLLAKEDEAAVEASKASNKSQELLFHPESDVEPEEIPSQREMEAESSKDAQIRQLQAQLAEKGMSSTSKSSPAPAEASKVS